MSDIARVARTPECLRTGARNRPRERDHARMVGQLHSLARAAGVPDAYARQAAADDRRSQLPGNESELIVLGRSLADAACCAGDHEAEAAVGQWLVDAAREDVGERRTAWLVLLGALDHANSPEEDPQSRERLRSACSDAIDDLDAAAREAELSPAARRSLIDAVTTFLERAEHALGIPSSPIAADLERRRTARTTPRPRGIGFLDKHGAGVRDVAARDGKAWWWDRFVDAFGVEPPEGWWTDDAGAFGGGRVSAEGMADGWFDATDEAAFIDEMERRFRSETGLPAPGGGRVGEPHLRSCLERVLAPIEVQCEASPDWLGRQRLDFYIPALGLAVEYQGEQHYLPLAHWGGEEGLLARRELDERKRDACARAGIRLLEWRYDEPVSVETVRRRLERAGIPVADSAGVGERAPGHVPTKATPR